MHLEGIYKGPGCLGVKSTRDSGAQGGFFIQGSCSPDGPDPTYHRYSW